MIFGHRCICIELKAHHRVQKVWSTCQPFYFFFFLMRCRWRKVELWLVPSRHIRNSINIVIRCITLRYIKVHLKVEIIQSLVDNSIQMRVSVTAANEFVEHFAILQGSHSLLLLLLLIARYDIRLQTNKYSLIFCLLDSTIRMRRHVVFRRLTRNSQETNYAVFVTVSRSATVSAVVSSCRPSVGAVKHGQLLSPPAIDCQEI